MNISLFFSILSFLPILFFFPGEYSLKNDGYIFMVSTLSIVNVVLFLFHTRKIYKNWFRADFLFLLGFIIIHFQIPLLSTYGIEPSHGNYTWVNKYVVNFATSFSAYAILFWIIGAHMFFVFKMKRLKNKDETNYVVVKKYLFNVTFVLSIVIWIATVGESFLSGSYAGVYNWGPGATYAFLILRSMLMLSVVYLFINNKGKFDSFKSFFIIFYRNKFFFVISLLYCAIFLFIGERGELIQLASTFLGGYVIYNRNISFKKIVVFIVFTAFLFTIIGLGRSSDASSRKGNLFAEGYSKFSEDDKFIIPTDELASSVHIQYLALDMVPDKHPYLGGITMFSNIIGVIPFGSRLVDIPKMYQNSTLFFTISEKGKDFEFGIGSEIISDIYINLGFVVTLIVFFVLGFFMSLIVYKATFIRNHKTVIIYLGVLALALYLNRSNILVPLKPIVYCLVLDYFLTKKIYV
jgi:oligosaccharide repeat unit polymerase